MLENIRNIFISKNGKLNNNYKLLFNKQTPELQEEILSIFPMYSDLGDKLKSAIENDYRHCPVCDKPMSWKDKNKTCSKECSKISLVENQEKTNLERYGVRNAAQSEQFELKKQQTNLERYGVAHPLKNKDLLDKMKETNNDKYGVDWVSQNKEVWDKQRNTCIERYGVEYAAQNSEVRQKNINTNLDRYGVEFPYQNLDFMLKAKKTILQNKVNYIFERTGEILSENEISSLILDTRYEYNTEYLIQLVNFIRNGVKPDFELIKNEYDDTRYYLVSKKYGYEFDYISTQEKEIEEFLKTLNVRVIRNSREILSPYELDFYLPDHKIAIEFNGSYWHSDKFKDKYYHQMKTKMCNDLGITLIHIYEYMYSTKYDIYKSIIKSKLQLNDRIFARKCDLREVSTQDEKLFLQKYHLQGYTVSKICYGLYFNDKLISICSFGKSRFDKNYEYELLRNCTLPNITVVGGMSKIIKYFKKSLNVKNILCYSDASISYNKYSELSQPNYVWINNNIVYKRYNTMKHKLHKLLGDKFDELLSETDNMKNAGFNKVYDSGNYKTIY